MLQDGGIGDIASLLGDMVTLTTPPIDNLINLSDRIQFGGFRPRMLILTPYLSFRNYSYLRYRQNGRRHALYLSIPDPRLM